MVIMKSPSILEAPKMVYKNKSKTRSPGKGRHMEANALKQMVLYSFDHRSCEIEKDLKVSHGVAVRVHAKVKKLGKGRHMEANALKQMVLYSFDHRSCEIEKDLKVSHGVAVRVHAKVKKLGLNK